jgi:hypothetical protein
LTQQECGPWGAFCWPNKFEVCSMGSARVMFLAWAPIFRYGGLSRTLLKVLRNLKRGML